MSRLFTERLSEGPILADGAMGTELIKLADVSADTCLEGLNLTAPDLVKQVHLDYLKAGAELIETNTYGANRVRLGSYGHSGSVKEINSKAVQIAREAERLTGQQVWVAGAVGPLGKGIEPLGPITVDDAREAFAEQIKALADAGVDVLLLETFPSLAEIQLAVASLRTGHRPPGYCAAYVYRRRAYTGRRLAGRGSQGLDGLQTHRDRGQLQRWPTANA